jgi:hypothetical protein
LDEWMSGLLGPCRDWLSSHQSINPLAH